MDFRQAWFELLNGKKIKLPTWSGYWAWEKSPKDGLNSIMMHTWDGQVIDIRDTDTPAYTFENIASHGWEVVNK